MANDFTPEVMALMTEFLQDAQDQSMNAETKEKWTGRDDLAKAFQSHLSTNDGVEREDRWVGDTTAFFPDARFWQIALFRVCAKRALHRIMAEEQSAIFAANEKFGMF